jgi:hypothetical protein
MKRFLAAIAITWVLSVSAFAGDMPISGSPAPPPPSYATTETTGNTDPGDIQTPGKALSSEALSALLSVLSFLAA